jgi:hypothetical protein
MPRDIPVGNGRLLVCFDQNYCIRDLYYPHVGQENHVGGHLFRLGFWVDQQFSWGGPEWKRDLRYLPNTLITLDSDGKEHHRTVGFLSPEELIPSLMLGMAKCHFDVARFDQTGLILEKLLAGYSRSDSAAEATYLRGGGRFKSTHDLKHLREAYERLQASYPSSEWTKKAYPYRLV